MMTRKTSLTTLTGAELDKRQHRAWRTYLELEKEQHRRAQLARYGGTLPELHRYSATVELMYSLPVAVMARDAEDARRF